MFNIDRHIGISAGWIAGPAFAVAMMAAPEYFHLGPAASAWLFWGGIAVFLATVAVLAFVSSHEEGKRRAVTGPIILMILGALIFCAGAAWYFWPNKTEAAAEGSPLDGAIQISCDPAVYPGVVPQNKMYELQLNNRFITNGGVTVTWMFPAGTPLPPRDPTSQPSNGSRFRITNYGKIAIINVNLDLGVEFDPNSEKSKKSVVQVLPVFSIAPGESVDIYAMNYSTDAVALVSIPPAAQGFVPGSPEPEIFKLIPPFVSGCFVGHFVPKSPPAPSPQVTSPPGKQGKK